MFTVAPGGAAARTAFRAVALPHGLRRREAAGPGFVAPAERAAYDPAMDAPEPLSAEQAEQVAFDLGAAAGAEVAFLRARQGIFFARRLPGERPSLSAVVRLVRGIYELEPRRAVWIVRNRILSTAPASAMCMGAVRVAARRLRAGIAARDRGLAIDLHRIDAGAALPAARRADPSIEPQLEAIVRAEGPRCGDSAAYLRLALRLAAEVERVAPRDPAADRPDRPVAALLVGAEGELLEWATNTGSRNATLHAEANLVELRLARGEALPAGARILATLKPCKMCAGLLWDAAADRAALRVFYAADDPGRYARETVLDRGSVERARVARDQAERGLAIQARLEV
jgi:tRNA(Arg) A34 adenosine deaminase TadA